MATNLKNLSEFDKNEMPSAKNFVIGIVVSEWNSHITKPLLKGAVSTLEALGVSSENIRIKKVPGSFELIYGCKTLCELVDADAVIAIGSVIRGETPHFDFVCQGVTQGIASLNLEYDTPVVFCVLTDDNEQQSIDRSGGKHGNKGVEAATTAIKMARFSNDYLEEKLSKDMDLLADLSQMDENLFDDDEFDIDDL